MHCTQDPYTPVRDNFYTSVTSSAAVHIHIPHGIPGNHTTPLLSTMDSSNHRLSITTLWLSLCKWVNLHMNTNHDTWNLCRCSIVLWIYLVLFLMNSWGNSHPTCFKLGWEGQGLSWMDNISFNEGSCNTSLSQNLWIKFEELLTFAFCNQWDLFTTTRGDIYWVSMK